MTARMLRQNVFVVRRNVLLWVLCAAVFLVFGSVRLDASYELPAAAGLGIAYAFYAAVYLGELGASGRLDSQIVCGGPRPQIWLSTWLTLTGSFVLLLLFALTGNLAGGLLRTDLDGNPLGWVICITGFILNAAAFAGLYTLAGLLIAGRRSGRGTLILILLICVYMALAFWDVSIENALMEEEYVPVFDLPPGVSVAVDDFDSLYVTDLIPNPNYVPEPQRSALESWSRFIPVLQSEWLRSFLYDGYTAETAGLILETYLYELSLAAASICLGLLLFQRRELD